MLEPRSQANFQIRLGWGLSALSTLADSDIIVVVDAIGNAPKLIEQAQSLPHAPIVFEASLRNATATARAVYDEQLARGGRTSINLMLAGDNGGFAVEDYLAAGAIGEALSALGIDHTAPDVAVAIEGFRPLKRALRHMFTACAAGQDLIAQGRADEVHEAAVLDADQVF